jgi:hypothetical protein
VRHEEESSPGQKAAPRRAFAALPTVKSLLYDLTISANGKMIGYTTTVCMGAKSHPSYVAATSTRTGKTARWTVPGGGWSAGQITVDPLVRYFLLQTGKLVLLDLSTGKIRYLPSGFPPGPLGVIWW